MHYSSRLATSTLIIAFNACLSPAFWGRCQGPELTGLFPAGGQRGSEVQVTLNGKFPNWPITIWCDQPDCVATATETSGKIKVAIAADAKPGIRWLRGYDARGASVSRPFVIGTAPEIIESAADEKSPAPQAVASLPTVLNGVLDKPGTADTFLVTLRKGQQLVASLDANRGPKSPVDATLQILNRDGIVMEQNLDWHGLDPQIVFHVPADGDYLVRVFGFPETPDSTIAYAGNANLIYRLTLTTGPFVEGTMPLAVTSESTTELQPFGFNIEGLKVLSVTSKAGDSPTMATFFPEATGALVLPVCKHLVVVEPQGATDNSGGLSEKGSNPPFPIGSQPLLPLPVCITGQVREPKEIDEYRFEAKSGQRWKMRLESRSLGYPMDGVMVVRDATGKQLVRQDDSGSNPDPVIEWACPSDGQYSVSVSDLYGQASDLHRYRLSIEPQTPHAELTVPNELLQATVGQPLEVSITITRKLDYADELTFRITGAPAMVTAEPVVSQAGTDSGKSVKLKLQSSEPFQGPLQIIAEPKSPVDQPATVISADSNRATLWLSIVAR